MTTETEPVARVNRPKVVAALLFYDAESQASALTAVASQVYEPSRVVVVGVGEDAAAFAASKKLQLVDSLEALVMGLEKEFEYVWVLHGDAEPRPDALQALVGEAKRTDASVVGSKILKHEDPEQLESVGAATDVFGEPYLGLDENEVDLQQYDVVRDVGFVAAVSLLIRRDLLRGLRGLDRMQPPDSAGIDLSQRARLAGGSVIVAPSSEVLHRRSCQNKVADWREQAGRIRSMFTAYKAVTLLWTVPLGLAVALFEGIGRLLMGKVAPLLNTIKAIAWNVAVFPTTLGARRRLRLIRSSGDEELFRYQVSGSIRLKDFFADLGEKLGLVVDSEPGLISEEDLTRDKSVAGPLVGGIVLFFAALMARSLWAGGSGFGGYMLLPDHPGDVLWSYAGGWNPTGLGTPIPPHPAAATVALAQLLCPFNSAFLTILNVSAGVLAIFGFSRMLSRLGAEGPSRHVGGFVYAVGPMAIAIGNEAYWPATLALGIFPWAVSAVLAEDKKGGGFRRRAGGIGAAMLTGGILGGLAPLGFFALIAALGVAAALGISKLSSVSRAFVATVSAIVVAGPYLNAVSPERLLNGFTIETWPQSKILVAALLVALAVGVVAGRHWVIAGWGGFLMGIGWMLSLLPSFGGELSVAAVLLVSAGMGAVVAEAFSFGRHGGSVTTAVRTTGALAVLVVVFSALGGIGDGRLGYPKGEWVGKFEFASALSENPGRILLISDPARIPGEFRVGPGFAYRLIDGDEVNFDEAWLYEPRNGDVALDAVLQNLASLNVTRPGEALSRFAIDWVVVEQGLPIDEAFVAQFDMAKIPLLTDFSVYANERARPVFDGPDASWVRQGVLGRGDPKPGLVKIAYNADDRFRPNPGIDGWGATVSPEKGSVGFKPDFARRAMALLGFLILGCGVGFVIWGRKESSE